MLWVLIRSDSPKIPFLMARPHCENKQNFLKTNTIELFTSAGVSAVWGPLNVSPCFNVVQAIFSGPL